MNIENNMMKKLILYKYYSKERWYSYVNIRQNQDEEHLQGHIGNKRTSDSNKKKFHQADMTILNFYALSSITKMERITKRNEQI